MSLLDETNSLIGVVQEREEKLKQYMKETQSSIAQTKKIEEALDSSLTELQDELAAMQSYQVTSVHRLGNIARRKVQTILDLAATSPDESEYTLGNTTRSIKVSNLNFSKHESAATAEPSMNRPEVSEWCCRSTCFSFSNKKVYAPHHDEGNSTLNTNSLSNSRIVTSQPGLPNI